MHKPIITALAAAAASGWLLSASAPASALGTAGRIHLASKSSSHGPGWMSPDLKRKKSGLVYISDVAHSIINIYPVSKTVQGPAPVGEITQGLNSPQSMAVDRNGNLYVANLAGNSVTEYAPGSITPLYTYTNSINQPLDVAVDSHGNVFTVMQPGYLLEFPQQSQNASLLVNLVGQGYAFYGVTVDANDNVFMSANFGQFGPGGIVEYSAGNTYFGLGFQVGYAAGVTVDKNDHVLMTDQALPGIREFQLGDALPIRNVTIGGSDPWYARFDAKEKNLYVSDQTQGEVRALNFKTGAQVNVYGTQGWEAGRPLVTGVAVSPADPL